MPASKSLKILSVRLPEAEVRRFKIIAATRGVTVQDAVHQALLKWTMEIQDLSPVEPLDALEGSLAGVDVEALLKQEREAESLKDSRR